MMPGYNIAFAMDGDDFSLEKLKQCAIGYKIEEGELATHLLMVGKVDLVERWLEGGEKLLPLTHALNYYFSQFNSSLITDHKGKIGSPVPVLPAVMSRTFYNLANKQEYALFESLVEFFDRHPEYQTDLHHLYPEQQFPLMIAHPVAAKALVRWGADPHFHTPIHHAYASWLYQLSFNKNHAGIYQELLNEVYPSFNPQPISHLVFARLHGYIEQDKEQLIFPESFQYLLDRGLKIHCPIDAPEVVQPLAVAIKFGEKHLVEWLYNQKDANVDVRWVDPATKRSLFHVAFEEGKKSKMDALKVLPMRELEPLVDHADINKNTPLHVAAATLDLEWCKKLLMHSTNRNALNKNKKHPLDMIRRTGAKAQKNLHLVWELFDNFDATQKIKGEPLLASMVFKASAAFSVETLKDLLQKNPDFDLEMKTLHGETPLFKCVSGLPIFFDKKKRDARMQQQLETTEFLIEKGACVDAQNNFLETPLHRAVHDRRVDVVELLLKSGANPHMVSLNNQPPAHMLNHEDVEGFDEKEIQEVLKIMKLLHDSGVDLFQKNNDDQYPFAAFRAIPVIESFLQSVELQNTTTLSGCVTRQHRL